jgi:hypothetical protein
MINYNWHWQRKPNAYWEKESKEFHQLIILRPILNTLEYKFKFKANNLTFFVA